MEGSFFPNLAVYFSHYECYGHTSRVIAVGEVFKKRFPGGNLFFVNAGVKQPKANIENIGKVYVLPHPTFDRHHFREINQGPMVGVESRRHQFDAIITKEHPNLLITEFFPLGMEESRHQLIPSLIRAYRQGAVLWGCAGYPLLTGRDYEWREQILKLYQKIIIFSPSTEKQYIADTFKSRSDQQRYLEFFEMNSKKIIFAGYLLPEKSVLEDGEDINLSILSISKKAIHVAVLRGGGAYFPKLIAQAIRSSDALGLGYYFTVIAGPSTSAEEWDFFNTLVEKKRIKNLVLLKSVINYEGLIRVSDICVSTASYHTAVMLLKYNKKSLLVPFEGNGRLMMNEQPARALMLNEMINSIILPIQELTANKLISSIKILGSRKQDQVKISKGWFMGADVLDEQLKGLFGR